MLKVKGLSVEKGKRNILNNISFEVNQNDILMIIGPNGAGKTTIIESIMNDIKFTGEISLNDIKVNKIKLSDISKQIGILMQKYSLEFDNTVHDIVSLGRYTHIKDIFNNLSYEDKAKIEEAMKIANIYDLRDRMISTLSGGELQRVFLSLVFAQDPNILILDEPTNHLDIKHQIEIFEVLKKWSLRENRAIIAILHDLNLAYKYGTKSLLIKQGKLVSYGDIKTSLNRENLKNTYDLDILEWMTNLISNWE